MSGLNHRSRMILFAVVAEYIASGTPVGSRTLARKYGLELSPASIRNVLADLEEAGYLMQPHTSAGRVPTDRALRAFIEALTDFEVVSKTDRLAMRHRFEQVLGEVEGGRENDVLRAAGKIISELSGAAAIVAASPTDSRKLTQLRFLRTKPLQLLAVLVFSDGIVENRYIELAEPIDDSDLERIHNLLADVVEGRSLGDVRDLFVRRLEDERTEVDRLRRRAFDLAHRAVSKVVDRGQVVIEGRARLMELPEYEDAEKLRRLVRVLEDRESLVDLLERTMGAGAVTVYIGRETGIIGDAELSLIAAPYGDAEKGVGTVGVLGPTRMDYARMMPLVDATAAALTAALKKGR
jgi:heat-inducible transcriptional repressor